MSDMPKFARQRLAHSPAGEHPDANLLSAFAEGALSSREREQVLAHLGGCAACRHVVSLAMPEVVAGALAPSRKRWLLWPMLRWAGVAAAVVVVAAAIMVEKARHAPVTNISAPLPTVEQQTYNAPATPQANGKAAEKGAAVERKTDSRNEVAHRDARAKATNADKKANIVSGQPNRDLVRSDSAAASNPTEKLQGDAEAGVRGVTPSSNAKAQTGAVGGLVVQKQAAAAPAAPPAASPQISSEEYGSADRAKANAQQSQKEESSVALDRMTGSATSEIVSSSKSTAKDSALAKKAKSPAGTTAGRAGMMNSALTFVARWQISSEGTLERSTDAGRTWQTVRVDERAPALRSVSAIGPDVWAGGPGGALYHSIDNGRSWSRIRLDDGSGAPEPDILRVEFTDAGHGTVTTSSGEAWVTADGGKTWRVRR